MEWVDIVKQAYIKAVQHYRDACPAHNYKSPVEIIAGQMQTEQIDNIVKIVQEMGVNVNKEELLRALRYDREQYEQGYCAGYAHREIEIVRCKDCKHKPKLQQGRNRIYLDFPDDICPLQCDDPWFSQKPDDNFFCAKGERNENEKKY